MAGSDVCVFILAIFLPPVAVFLRRGCGVDILINILLCLLGHIPGVIHAFYIIWHDSERKRQPRVPYGQQTQQPATYGAPAPAVYGDNNINHQQYGQQTQQPYFDQQPRTVAPEPTPPVYTDETHMKGEKHDYTPIANGPATKEI